MQGLTVSPSPHIKSFVTTQKVMSLVLIALLPAVVASGIIFGLQAIIVIAVSAASAVIWEYVARKIMKRSGTISDLSAAVTGVIFAMNLPVTIPLWMVIIGTFVAIVILGTGAVRRARLISTKTCRCPWPSVYRRVFRKRKSRRANARLQR